MRTNPKPQEMYRHFKGNIYQIRCLAKHSETGETMVVYQAMYDTFQIYVRPLDMFMEEVDRDRYPEAKQKYRFELLQDMELSSAAQTETFEQEEAEAPAPAEEVPAPVVQPAVSSRTVESEEQMHIDPLVMEFLDAGTFEQKLNILAALRHRITDSMINTLAAASDLEIKGGNVEERYDELRSCLQMFAKFECNRLR
ncbi:MAG: DUF1653 domain-containing protein [Lachnospiraceae bacterium]|nr:DUF1653 domain-containing protein [Lachnospiraceae bacterium]